MIVVRIWEGLGNQLFQYSYAKALQLRTGQKVYIDVSAYAKGGIRKYGLDNFKITLPVINHGKTLFNYVDSNYLYTMLEKSDGFSRCGFPMRFAAEEHTVYKAGLRQIYGNWYLKGWFQDERYFAQYADVLRKEIRPRNKIKVSPKLRDLLENRETVAVHFRRSDFRKSNNMLSDGYYSNAMGIMEDKIQEPCYMVFSDDLKWVKQHIRFGKECHYINEGGTLKDYEELLVMSRCRHHIIANSTFSWWGAWLNNNEDKVVIAPRIWFMRENNKDISIVPKSWIKI